MIQATTAPNQILVHNFIDIPFSSESSHSGYEIRMCITNNAMLETPAPSFLPQEICELCIDALAAKDDKENRTALAQCLHVNHAFWTRARQHIFSEVKVKHPSTGNGPSVEEQLVALLDMMTANEVKLRFSIAKLIKSFTLDISYERNVQIYTNAINTPSLPGLLKECLEAKILRSLSIFMVMISWKEINPSIQNLVHTLCREPNFKYLALSGINNVPTHLLDGATINDLAIDHIYLGSQGNAVLDSHSASFWLHIDTLASPPELDSLQVNNVFSNLEVSFPSSRLDAGLPFTRLKRLRSIIHGPNNLQATGILVMRARRTLRNLQLVLLLDLRRHRSDLQNPFDLAQLPMLRHLHLVSGMSKYLDELDTINYFCQFIPPPSALESLTVVVVVRTPVSREEQPWHALEGALIRSQVPILDLTIRVEPPAEYLPRAPVSTTAVFATPATLSTLFATLKKIETIDFTFNVVDVSQI